MRSIVCFVVVVVVFIDLVPFFTEVEQQADRRPVIHSCRDRSKSNSQSRIIHYVHRCIMTELIIDKNIERKRNERG
jgi:hypothetical protein